MVEIIMGTYNGERYLSEQIESVCKSLFQDWCLTIRDDGSKDRTLSIAQTYEKQYKDKIRVMQNEQNKGPVKNFLSALRESKAEYIMFCDQDDVWKENKIGHTLDKMREMEQKYGQDMPIAVFTDNEITDAGLNVISGSFFRSGHLNPAKVDISHMLIENKLIGCTVMVNKALKEKITFMPEHARMHDWWAGLIAAGFGKIGYLNEATMYYRQHENNVVGGNTGFFRYIKNRVGSLRRQKAALDATIAQGRELYLGYQGQFSGRTEQILGVFSKFKDMPWWKRKYYTVKYGFFKTGLIRNIGLLLLI